MKKLLIAAVLSMTALGPGMAFKAYAITPSKANILVDQARLTLNDFRKTPNMRWFHKAMRDSKGVLVVPDLVKAGLILGGSGGAGVFFMKDKASGLCKGPAFYNMGSFTFGLQAGFEKASVVIFAMDDAAVNAMLSPQFKLGADASAALGMTGRGAAAQASLPAASFIVFSRNRGVYGGLTLEGTVVTINKDYNRTYYGKNLSPAEILIAGEKGSAGGLCTAFERAGL